MPERLEKSARGIRRLCCSKQGVVALERTISIESTQGQEGRTIWLDFGDLGCRSMIRFRCSLHARDTCTAIAEVFVEVLRCLEVQKINNLEMNRWSNLEVISFQIHDKRMKCCVRVPTRKSGLRLTPAPHIPHSRVPPSRSSLLVSTSH